MKYILVQWPESQMLMEHDRFDECFFVDIGDHTNMNDPVYICPEDLYNEIFK